MRFALVCFDLDGTLVDSVEDIRAGLAHALAAVPGDDPALDARALAEAGEGRPLEEVFARARPRGSGDQLARFGAAYRGFYHAHPIERTRPFPGVLETLAALDERRARGLRTAVATTKRSETARRVIDALGLARHFDLVLGTDGMPHKPAPDLLLAVARAVERDARDGLMVGDSARDVAAGRAAGMRTCGVTWGALGDGMRALAPDWVPDWVIDRMEQILPIVDGGAA